MSTCDLTDVNGDDTHRLFQIDMTLHNLMERVMIATVLKLIFY